MDLILFGILNKRIREVAQNNGKDPIIIDTTLKNSGQAADAKAVGDRLTEMLKKTQEIKDTLDKLPLAPGDDLVKVLKINGVELEIEDGVVNIPVATDETCGVVKSTSEENGVTVDEDGTMKVNNISLSKIVQTENDEFIFVGGDSDM